MVTMLRRIFKGVVAAALLALLLAAGCGGSDDIGTSSLTKAQFVKRADAICRDADEAQIKAMSAAQRQEASDGASKADEEDVLLSAGLPPVQEQAEEIFDLGAPEGDEEEVEAYVAAVEEGVEKAEDNPETLATAFVEADKLAKKYGFKDCAETL